MLTRLLTATVLPALLLPAGAARGEPIETFGDARLSFVASERDARDGTTTEDEGVRLRLRGGAETRLAESWLLHGRLAGRFTTDQDRTRLWLKAWTPTRTGLEDGDATVDEFYLRYAPAHGDWALTFGRFQSKFELMGVAAKSLDRNDSPNVEITWTDGLHWRYELTSQWRSHVVLQSNASRGTGQATRGPLVFDDSNSRVTAFAALEATAPLGPLTQRVFSATWMPRALATDGIGAERRQDYVALTARLFAEWPIGASGMRGGLGGEVGYAPVTPTDPAVNAGDSGRAGGSAHQFSMNLYDLMPGHNIGFVFGHVDAGWLLSPDFRNNDRLLEIRYQWRITKNLSMETRLRRREELKLPAAAARERIDDDFYLRFTAKF